MWQLKCTKTSAIAQRQSGSPGERPSELIVAQSHNHEHGRIEILAKRA
jgi:hypothetical protein